MEKQSDNEKGRLEEWLSAKEVVDFINNGIKPQHHPMNRKQVYYFMEIGYFKTVDGEYEPGCCNYTTRENILEFYNQDGWEKLWLNATRELRKMRSR